MPEIVRASLPHSLAVNAQARTSLVNVGPPTMSRTLGVLRQLLDQALPGHRPAHEDYELVETGTSNLYSPLPLLCFSS